MPDEALSVMEAAVEFGDRSGHPVIRIGTRADLAWIYGSLGALDRGLELARKAVAISAEARFHPLRSWPQGVLARLLLLQGDCAGAEAALAAGWEDFQLEC